eukprot:CAMPEP_0198287564 /NCGR_PEP_ID=MMETSP1449-20131203/6325_1 /TAXON_ID=420275 /ORGANISM="Attheya septentrionalis, Strain CCMP2084" /LENGTH=76 /DNA_ID=CAMNT_0043985527 /DNA_START=23 /DNA_END=254 /DNA_ORIENTATION=+
MKMKLSTVFVLLFVAASFQDAAADSTGKKSSRRLIRGQKNRERELDIEDESDLVMKEKAKAKEKEKAKEKAKKKEI